MANRRTIVIAAACLLLVAGCRAASQARPIAIATGASPPVETPAISASATPVSQPAFAPATVAMPVSAELIPRTVNIPPMPPRYLETEMQNSTEAPLPAIGTMRTFRVADLRASGYRTVSAILRYAGARVTIWVEEGIETDAEALAASAQTIEERILPALTRLYPNGSAQSRPARYAIVNMRTAGMSGYYIAPEGAAREQTDDVVLVMNLSAVQPGTERYNSVLAHELQHAQLSQLDPNEAAWLSEGASQLLETLAGFPAPSGAVTAYSAAPDVQLNTWSSARSAVYRHYGASFLFLQYYYERYGDAGVRMLLGASEDGTAAFDRTLDELDGSTFRDLYARWALANLLDRPEMYGGAGAYAGIDLELVPQDSLSRYPETLTLSTPPYATRYVEFLPTGATTPVSVTIELDAPVVTRIVPAEVTDGLSMWWSNRGDLGHSWLQRNLDLRQAAEATLTFDLWHDIEPGWDWAGVRISIDGGEQWVWLQGEQTVESSAGTGAPEEVYTGSSGEGSAPDRGGAARWVTERIDLTPYAGRQVLLRFDMFTDDAQTGPGLCLDNIAVDEVGWRDADSLVEGWVASGFVRTDGVLPVAYSVQAVVYSGDSVTVHQMEAQEGHGAWLLPDLGGSIDRAVLVISATTDPMGPLTTEAIPVTLSVRPAP